MNPTDLVERLRYYAGLKSIMPTNASACFLEAADALASLRDRLKALTEALDRYGDHEHDCKGRYDESIGCSCGLTTALARDD